MPAPSTTGNVLTSTGSEWQSQTPVATHKSGLWTPTDQSGAGLTLTGTILGRYVKIGPLVYLFAQWMMPANSNGATMVIGPAPFQVYGGINWRGAFLQLTDVGIECFASINANNQCFYFCAFAPAGAFITNAQASGKMFRVTALYRSSVP